MGGGVGWGEGILGTSRVGRSSTTFCVQLSRKFSSKAKDSAGTDVKVRVWGSVRSKYLSSYTYRVFSE